MTALSDYIQHSVTFILELLTAPLESQSFYITELYNLQIFLLLKLCYHLKMPDSWHNHCILKYFTASTKPIKLILFPFAYWVLYVGLDNFKTKSDILKIVGTVYLSSTADYYRIS